MKTFLVRVVVNAVAIWVATLVVSGIEVSSPRDSTGSTVVTYLVIGAIFGVVNAVVKPVVKLVAFPFYVLTLGLLTFVVNALMLELTAWISSHTSLTLRIDHFWWDAIWGAFVVTVVSVVLSAVLPDGDD